MFLIQYIIYEYSIADPFTMLEMTSLKFKRCPNGKVKFPRNILKYVYNIDVNKPKKYGNILFGESSIFSPIERYRNLWLRYRTVYSNKWQ